MLLEIRPLHGNFRVGYLLLFEKNQVVTDFFMEECDVCDQILPDAWEQTQPWQCPGPGVSPHRHLDIVVMVKKITLTSLRAILILEQRYKPGAVLLLLRSPEPLDLILVLKTERLGRVKLLPAQQLLTCRVQTQRLQGVKPLPALQLPLS